MTRGDLTDAEWDRLRIRREMGRGPRAVATIIDSQSVKAAATVGRDSRGYDAGKKINGRKRHLVVDTRGLPLFVMVTPADLHDSAAAKEVLFRLRLMHPEITIVWADRAYTGKLVTWPKRHLNLTVKTVSQPKDTSGFIVLPRRWVVERSLAWMMNARHHARRREWPGTEPPPSHAELAAVEAAPEQKLYAGLLDYHADVALVAL
jgi:transposase